MATPEEMDAAANEAEEDLNNLPDEAVGPVAAWWAKWFAKAGHKRLGRILVAIDRENAKKKGGETG